MYSPFFLLYCLATVIKEKHYNTGLLPTLLNSLQHVLRATHLQLSPPPTTPSQDVKISNFAGRVKIHAELTVYSDAQAPRVGGSVTLAPFPGFVNNRSCQINLPNYMQISEIFSDLHFVINTVVGCVSSRAPTVFYMLLLPADGRARPQHERHDT